MLEFCPHVVYAESSQTVTWLQVFHVFLCSWTHQESDKPSEQSFIKGSHLFLGENPTLRYFKNLLVDVSDVWRFLGSRETAPSTNPPFLSQAIAINGSYSPANGIMSTLRWGTCPHEKCHESWTVGYWNSVTVASKSSNINFVRWSIIYSIILGFSQQIWISLNMGYPTPLVGHHIPCSNVCGCIPIFKQTPIFSV